MAPSFRIPWFARRRSSDDTLLTTTPVRVRPALDFSFTGLLYCSIMLFMGLAALNSQANLLFGIFGLMIGILLISGVISRLVLRDLRVRRLFPAHGTVGEPMRAVYEITNLKKFWPSLSVSLAELDGVQGFTVQPQCYMLHAAPTMTASVLVDVTPKRRGLHQFDRYQLGTGFPFGFVKRALSARHKDQVLIYPALGQLDERLLSLCRSAEISGSTVRPRPGGIDEFYGVKEFREGENRRNIYWRRSARTGVLVAKEMTRVAPPRLVLLIDTFMSPDVSDCAEIERVIAMAATLASATLEQGLSVGLFAWQHRWLSLVPDRGKQQRTDLLSALARLPVNREAQLEELLEECSPLLRPAVTPVLFTSRNVQLGMIEEMRGGMVVVSAASGATRNWFRFAPTMDFSQCGPVEDQG